MSEDVLSDVLDLVRLSGAHLLLIDVRGSWCVSTNPTIDDFPAVVEPGNQQVIAFHVVVDGHCVLRCGDDPWLALRAGDAVVLAHGGTHALGDRPQDSPLPIRHVIGNKRLCEIDALSFGSVDKPRVRLLCGFLGCQCRAFEPLFASLPDLFRVHLDAHSRSLVDAALREIAMDTPGGLPVRTRMTEVLFMQALRGYLDSLPGDAQGLLAGIRDPVVGRAMQLMHARLRHDWTVQSLADAAASSRSHLATRFREILGQPPMQYLTTLRMHRAARLLRQGGCTVAGLAEEVGYASPAAFQRAFKRHFGMAPGSWRSRVRRGRPVRPAVRDATASAASHDPASR